MRLLKLSTRSNAANHEGELQRCDRDRPLADGDGNRFTGIPFPVIHALYPFFRRYEAGFFRGEIDSRLGAEAKHFGIFGYAIDTHALADVVKENVARMDDRMVQIHDAMATFTVNVALE